MNKAQHTTSQLAPQSLVRAICNEAGATAPTWIELLPVGDIIGRDGRAWKLEDAQKVLNAFTRNNYPLPIDYEHATEIKAIRGEKAPAVGWIEELALENNIIMGRVSWTEEGQEVVSKREYRFVSPVFLCTKSGEIVQLTSVGLTNQPNLHLKALNSQELGQNLEQEPEQELEQPKQQGDDMSAICKRLGIKDDASEPEILAAIELLQTERASNKQAQTLENVVPRTEYDALQIRALGAEKALKEHADTELEKAINCSLDAAITAKKIAPASKDYFMAMCRTENGLQEFQKFVSASPTMLEPSGLDGKEAPNAGAGLTEVEKATCRAMNLSEEDFVKSKEVK